MPLSAGDRLLEGKYRILKRLGRGGFSIVYLAADTIVGRQVAIKELRTSLLEHPPQVDRFVTDGRLGILLRHPNIVEVYDVFRTGDNYYIAMEYLTQGSLAELVYSKGSLQLDMAVRIISAACRGLAYAHRMGVVHCDVKPANILFGRRGAVKVSDFGIAHVSRELAGRSWETATHSSLGTLVYMSPEQLTGVRDDPRIDVYALGAVLYETLTGRLYLDFDAQQTPDAYVRNVLRIAREPPLSFPSRVPAWLRAIVLKALQKDPSARYADAGQLRIALHEGLPVRVPAAPSAPTVASAPPMKGRPPSRESPRHKRAEHPPQAEGKDHADRAFFQIHPGVAALYATMVAFLAILWVWGAVGPPAPPGEPAVTPRPVDSPTAMVTELPSPIPGTEIAPTGLALLFQDDFSDPKSGWSIQEWESGSVGYREGVYVVTSVQDTWLTIGENERSLLDVIIEVDATLVSEPPGGHQYHGVGCRVRGLESDGYWFLVRSPGLYAIYSFEAGDVRTIVDWTVSDVVRPEGQTNRMTIECVGSTLSLSMNGQSLATATDSSHTLGHIALLALTDGDEPTEVHFDNLVAHAPTYSTEPTPTAPPPLPTKAATVAPTPTPAAPPPTPTPLCPAGLGCIRVINRNCAQDLYFTIADYMHTISGSPTAVIQVPPGEYAYTVSTPGHESFNGTIGVEAGRIYPLAFTCEYSWDSPPPRQAIRLEQ